MSLAQTNCFPALRIGLKNFPVSPENGIGFPDVLRFLLPTAVVEGSAAAVVAEFFVGPAA